MTSAAELHDYQLLSGLTCTTAEKRELFPVVDELLELSNRARQYGLYELEKKIGWAGEPLLKKGLALMVDGTEPEAIRKILLNYLLCSDSQGKELLRGILIIDSILAIQEGWHPQLIRELLFSYLGLDMMKEAEKDYPDKAMSEYVRNYITGLSEEETNKSVCTILEDPIEKINDRCLQRLLRELDYVTVAVALRGASKKIQEKVFANVSLRVAFRMAETISNKKNITLTDITEAQKTIMKVAQTLIQQGEIII